LASLLHDTIRQPGKDHDMRQDEARASRRRGQGRRRLRRAALVAVALGSVALLAAACSGSSGAGADPGTSPGNATAGDLTYSQCMRSHGISNFPDPNSNGSIGISASSGINPNSSQYLAASKACQSKLGGQQNEAQQIADYPAELKYAHCMQSRGVEVPDPQAPGAGGANTQSNSSPGSPGASNGNGVNPNSPQYIAASKACQRYLPTGQGPSLSGNGGGS
jgi:hypothetical protein